MHSLFRMFGVNMCLPIWPDTKYRDAFTSSLNCRATQQARC